MDAQTKEVLEECSSGCRMALDSFTQMQGHISDQGLGALIDTYEKKHRKYEQEAFRLLGQAGYSGKEPGMMASAFSKAGTEMKLMMRSDSGQIAKLILDGCTMGIENLGACINRCPEASGQSLALAQDIIKTEESLMREVQRYL